MQIEFQSYFLADNAANFPLFNKWISGLAPQLINEPGKADRVPNRARKVYVGRKTSADMAFTRCDRMKAAAVVHSQN